MTIEMFNLLKAGPGGRLGSGLKPEHYKSAGDSCQSNPSSPSRARPLGNRQSLLGPLGPSQLHGHQVDGIGTLRLNRIPLPPGEIAAKLKS